LYYNEKNEQIGTLDPEHFLTTFERDSAGNVVRTNVYMNRYDVPADDTQAPAPLPGDPVRATSLVYDGADNRVQQTASDGAVTDYLYDSARKLLKVTNHAAPDPERQARTADLADRVLSYEYDAAGRLKHFVNADDTEVTYDYDTANNKTRETLTNPTKLATGLDDPVRTTTFAYDAVNRQVSQTFDPGGLALTETLTYDKAGNLIGKTDPPRNQTLSSYELNNQLTRIEDALGHETTFTYDLVGNQTSITDGRGNRSDFTYDKNDRLVKQELPAVDVFTIADGLKHNVRPTTEIEYDAAGN